MRALNRNERLLAIALGVVLFVIVNLVAMRWLGDQMRTTRAGIAQLEAQAQQFRLLLNERDFWMARQEWMTSHPPDVYDARATRAAFASEVQASLSTAGLKTVAPPQPLDDAQNGGLTISSIDLTVDGRLESIVRWLHSVQQPGRYIFIPSLSLKQGEEGKTMQLQARLSKVYRAAGDLPPP